MNPPADTVIFTNELTRYFDEFLAVDHVTFQVYQGEVIGYLGPNGSGKTTTIRMLLGLLLPSEGYSKVLGLNPVTQSEKVRAKVGYMSQKFSLYTDLTVRENLEFYAGVYGINDSDKIRSTLELVGMAGNDTKMAGELSTGLRQRLALAAAIVHDPQLLFLDEPTSGVDPSARRVFWDLIYELVDQGITAIITTHYMDEAEYCGRVGIMQDGCLLALDTPAELKVNAMPGQTWDMTFYGKISGDSGDKLSPMIHTLEKLQHSEKVIRAGLVSDHLRIVTSRGFTPELLYKTLKDLNIPEFHLQQVEPTLEDVFLSLAVKEPAS